MNWVMAVLAILFIGDSYTACTPGYVGDMGERVPLYHIADSILYLQDLPADRVDVIVLELGIHVIRGSDRAYSEHPRLFPDMIVRRYDQLLSTAAEKADIVVVVNVPWTPSFVKDKKLDRVRDFNSMVDDLAAWNGAIVVDAYTLFEACGVGCFAEDGLHPNGRGYTILHDAVALTITPLPIVDGCPVPV